MKQNERGMTRASCLIEMEFGLTLWVDMEFEVDPEEAPSFASDGQPERLAINVISVYQADDHDEPSGFPLDLTYISLDDLEDAVEDCIRNGEIKFG